MSERPINEGDGSYCLTYIVQKKPPKDMVAVVNFCVSTYNYHFVGVDAKIHYGFGKSEQRLYFRDPKGDYHCLVVGKYTPRTTERRPLFAW